MGILAVSTVLRPSVVVIGPVLPSLQADLGLDSTAAALLSTLPILCFGLGAFAGPRLTRRFGLDLGLSGALALLITGALVRVLGGSALLFVGTAAVGAGIAVGNVLLSALVRRDFAARIGPVTGLYTSTLAMSSALAALSAVPLAEASSAGWRAPLVLWCGCAIVALLVWLPHQWTHRGSPPDGPAAVPALSLLRRPAVRSLTAYMGLQSIGFYTMVTWLPTILQDHGESATRAGVLLSLATVLGIPAALVVPVIAARMHHQRVIVVATTALTGLGWTGLLVAPDTLPVLWTVLLGAGTGSTFPVALLLIVLRSSDPAVTPQLSAVVQGVGYLIAAGGPLLVGMIRQTSGSWTLPLAFLVMLCLLQAWVGWSAGRAQHI